MKLLMERNDGHIFIIHIEEEFLRAKNDLRPGVLAPMQHHFFGWRRRGKSTFIGFTMQYLTKRFKHIIVWRGHKVENILDEYKSACNAGSIPHGNIFHSSVLRGTDFTGKRRRVRYEAR